MTYLTDLYTDFFRIDLDARGGYARVANVLAKQKDGTSTHRAFKLMRHELGEKQDVGMQRFENELKILVEITTDKKAPNPITRIYDSGFAPVELSLTLHKLRDGEKLSPNLEVISTGIDLQKFLEVKSTLLKEQPDHWLPYLVVDLAPYADSLLRQINPQSANELTNLYRLPITSIVDMAIQLLDVIDYLHKKLQYAYIDWKPEHIFWNGSIKQLTLIDWNVTNRLLNSSKDRTTIREDLRMFSGAALYCSLALTDPEDFTRSIGPEPILPENLTPVIPPRYWTDKPNFYERDAILDEQIKQIVQKGLDPKQGFSSALELKNALRQYAEQRAKQGDSRSDDQKNRELIAKLPQEAVQHFRRARSYIAAADYSYAEISLEAAIETAKTAGMIYPDAENLLQSVRNILQAGEFREKVKLALEQEEWDSALSLYKKAIELTPSNTTMQKEFNGLQGLLRSQAQLRNKSLARIFINTFRLQAMLESTKDLMHSRNPLYAFVKRQSNQIRFAQFTGVFAMLMVVFFSFGFPGKLNFSGLFPMTAVTNTNSPNNVSSETPTLIPVSTPTPVKSNLGLSITSTITTIMPTATVTNTIEPSPTVTIVTNYGVLNTFFFPVDEPNGQRIGVALQFNQLVTIVDSKEDRGQLWYKCIWEIDGDTGEGWILGANIQFVPQPTPSS